MKICTFLLAVFFLGVTDVLAQSTTVSSPSRTPTVLIIPFKQVDPTAGHQWISSAIQEDLIIEASQGGYTQAKTAAAPLASADTAQALQEGKDADAELVIFGNYQVSGDQLRVSGEAGDVAAGKVVGTLGVTGQMQDLFKIEDTLAAQLRPLLPRPAGLPQVTYGINQSSVPVYDQGTANAEAPAQTIYSYPYPAEPDQNNYSSAYYPYTSYAYPYYDGGYAYPYYYDYGYPGYYGGLFIGGGYYGRGFYGHGGFDHGGFRGGFHGSVGGFHGGAAFGGAHGFAGGGHGGFGGGGHGR